MASPIVATAAGTARSPARTGNIGCGCADCRRRRQLTLEALIDSDVIDQEVSGNPVATTAPTPGRFYDIQHGQGGLLATAGRAYGLGPGAKRLASATAINNHEQNRKFWVAPSNTFERNNFPQGIISFSSIFTCGADQRRARGGDKRCFARIYIPLGAVPQRPRPDERRGCDVPPRTAEGEFELEMEIADLQHETPKVPLRSRLCLYQNAEDSSACKLFHCGALRQARHIGAIEAPVRGSCRRRIGPTPYDTGADIISAIEAAHACLRGRAVDEVHIFSHGGPAGVYGREELGSKGLYEAGFAWVDRAGGGRTVGDIPTAALANNVRFVLHGCNTANGADNFALALYRHLAGTLTNPRVYGHRDGGCAGRNNRWREYSNRHPSGRSLRSLPEIVSDQPFGGRGGCCKAT